MNASSRASGLIVLACLHFLLHLATQSHAAVTGFAPTPVPTIAPGTTGTLGFRVQDTHPDGVHGINGTLTYNANLLTNPRVAAGPGAPGYDARGFVTAAGPPQGTFKFILMGPPGGAAVNPAQPALNFIFDAVPGSSGNSTVNFTAAAAGRYLADGAISVALGGPGGVPPARTVSFQMFTVSVVTPPTPTPSPTPTPLMLGSPNEETSGNFGIAIAGTADATGDGKGDVIVGAYLEDPGSSPLNSGRAYVFDGVTGAPWSAPLSPSPAVDGNFGRNVQGIADLTSDGRNEILIGAWQENAPGGPVNSGRVHIYSGATGLLKWTLDSPNPDANGRFGARVSGGGDVNGDGKQDVFVGAPYENPGASPADSGRAYIFSGATRDLLRTLQSPNPLANGLFGFFIAGFYDLTGDARGDLVVGAHLEEAPGNPADSGRAYAFNGSTGALLYTLESPTPCFNGWFGRNLARVFDMTGDGRLDIVVGAPQENSGSQPARAGRVHLFNGATGAHIRTITSPNGAVDGNFGWFVQSLPDVNADGKGEILIGAQKETVGLFAQAGRAYLFSGAGGLLKSLVSPNPQASGLFGVSVHGVQDTNGDGIWEIAVSSRAENPGGGPAGAGRVYLFKSPAY